MLTPKSPIRAIVVFGHGWKTAPPSPGYPWVGQFEPWLEHLLGGGSAVIFPRYQLGLGDPQDRPTERSCVRHHPNWREVRSKPPRMR